MHLIAQVDKTDRHLICTFADGSRSLYPFVFLRDNDPAKIHANGQRMSDPATLDLNIHPKIVHVAQGGSAVSVQWHDGRAFYDAYLCWAKMLQREQYALSFSMAAGDMYIVNNERVLHS